MIFTLLDNSRGLGYNVLNKSFGGVREGLKLKFFRII